VKPKAIKTVDEAKELRNNDIIKLKIKNFPTRATVISNNTETRVISIKYRLKRGKMTSTKITALTYDEIMQGHYKDNVKKHLTTAAVLATGVGGGIALGNSAQVIEIIKIILELINSL
jgi:hypothetical protein